MPPPPRRAGPGEPPRRALPVPITATARTRRSPPPAARRGVEATALAAAGPDSLHRLLAGIRREPHSPTSRERLDEERIPSVASRQTAANSGPPRAERALGKPHDRPGAQRPRPENGRLGSRRQACQLRDALTAPGGGEDREGEAVQPGRQVVEEAQRLGIGPVDVVDGEGNGARRRRCCRAASRGRGAWRRRCRPPARAEGPGRGEQRLRPAGGTREQAVALGFRRPGDDGARAAAERSRRRSRARARWHVRAGS